MEQKQPVWRSDTEIDPAWITENCKLPCERCEVKDISNANRDGSTLRLSVSTSGEQATVTLIMKRTSAGNAQQTSVAKALGLAREALFYSELAPALDHSLPKIYYAVGDMATGVKTVVMEDLGVNFIDSGVLFGPGNPNNRGRDLAALSSRAGTPAPPPAAVAKATFKAIAVTHAKYWKDENLLNDSFGYLRGSLWVAGKGREQWQSAQTMCQDRWKAAKEVPVSKNADGLETGPGGIVWEPNVLEALVACVNKISWESQCERLNRNSNWTLVHGDFWPGNVMWRCPTEDSDEVDASPVKLIDWEMVGLGSGPQDLGQYVLSNMDPKVRKQCENEIVRAYYDTLIANGVSSDTFSWDMCWNEYVHGGLERWMWFLTYFAGGGAAMATWTQFFHDQVAAMMRDHNISPDDLGQPRP